MFEPHNGNFLKIVELMSGFDSIMKEHVYKVLERRNEKLSIWGKYSKWNNKLASP